MTSTINALESIAAAPPSVPADDVARAVGEQFGLVGEYEALISERDQNFRLTTSDGSRFVVKLVGSAEEPAVTRFQIEALSHVAAREITGAPRVVLTTAGQDRGQITDAAGETYVLRVVTWLSGTTLGDLPMTEGIATTFGRDLASLDIALQDFAYAGENQVLLWDMQRAGELRRLTGYIDDLDLRETVEDVLDEFVDNVAPAFGGLPRQVIHNDANPGNVLLAKDRKQVLFIDFGDMLRAPRIVEVATAAAYLRADSSDPLRFITAFVVAYHRRNPLSPDELSVLFTLLQTRLCMTLVLLFWRLSARDVADPYRLKALEDERDAAAFLRALTRLGSARFLRHIHSVISIKTDS